MFDLLSNNVNILSIKYRIITFLLLIFFMKNVSLLFLVVAEMGLCTKFVLKVSFRACT